MKSIDIIILGILIVYAIVGFWKGFTRQLLGMLTWMIALAITYFFYGVPKSLVGLVVSHELTNQLISMALVFIVSLIILTSITYSISDAIRSSIVGGVDRIMGFFWGAAKGTLMLSAILFGVQKLLFKPVDEFPTPFKESMLIPMGIRLIDALAHAVPQHALHTWEDKTEALFDTLLHQQPKNFRIHHEE